jgi:hypothetical protein
MRRGFVVTIKDLFTRKMVRGKKYFFGLPKSVNPIIKVTSKVIAGAQSS